MLKTEPIVKPTEPPAVVVEILPIDKVVVHPLVLLSVVDHFNRMGKVGHQKRVVGALLGTRRKGVLDVNNSFAVPFDEDDNDQSVWFLDHDYLENMYNMFKKVNAREKIVGWYHTGPKLHQNDVAINELVRRYCHDSVMVVIGAKPKEIGLPTEAYIVVEEVHDDGTPTTKTFEHLPSAIGAEEAEEVGVEHLLRDIKDTTVGTLSQRVTNQLMGIKGLHSHIEDIASYLGKVSAGELPVNHAIIYHLQVSGFIGYFNHTMSPMQELHSHIQDIASYLGKVSASELPVNHAIIYHLQDVFNLLPDVSLLGFVKSVYVKTNDQMLVVYLASLIRSVIALHNLINNKVQNRDAEHEKDTPLKKDKTGDTKDTKKDDKKSTDKKGDSKAKDAKSDSKKSETSKKK